MIVSAIKTTELVGRVPAPNTAVLRILDPVDEATDLGQGWGAVLQLAFWDMDASALGVKGRLITRLWGKNRALFESLAGRLFGNDIPWRPFIAADALDIAHFADGLKERGVSELLVVCRNGRGRSSTVGRWIAARLGASFETTGQDRQSGYIKETLDRVGGIARVEPHLTKAA
jgi:hypothetical protein